MKDIQVGYLRHSSDRDTHGIGDPNPTYRCMQYQLERQERQLGDILDCNDSTCIDTDEGIGLKVEVELGAIADAILWKNNRRDI
jgi:hypothetical protein